MKILIIGAGALGSYFGGCLQKGGNDVTLVCRNREHREAILSNGLCLETFTNSKFHVYLKAVTAGPTNIHAAIHNYIYTS